MTHLDMLRALAEANRTRDWAEAARLRTLETTPTPCATPAEAAYCARSMQAVMHDNPHTHDHSNARRERDCDACAWEAVYPAE